MKSILPKVLLVLTGLTTFLCNDLKAQIETDTTFNYQMNTIFSNVDKSKVPYGYLRDYAMEFANLEDFNGTTALVDSNYIDDGILWDIYKTLYTARIYSNASGLLHPDTLNNRWYTYRQPGRITLAGIYFKYSRFRDDAANNFITINNNQLYDKYVSGVWQNPYQTEQVFAISPSVTLYQGKSFQILLPAELWRTNSSSTISNISINTGSGYVTLSPGSAISVNYTDTSTKEWTYRLTQTDGTMLYAHSKVKVVNDPLVNSNVIARFGASTQEDVPITASESYLGSQASGIMTIVYADADRGLRRPLIVAEGYDAGSITQPENKYGELSITNFQTLLAQSSSSSLKQLLVNNPQFDIIYVNWKNGTDYIQRNALLLEEVIRWVNNNKEPLTTGGYATNVVIGQSMGGLCARYALRDMENKGQNHQTRLYVSYDAPHQGANTPQGYQHLALHTKNMYLRAGITQFFAELIIQINNPSITKQLSLSSAPASQQMLITYVKDNNTVDNSIHNAWQTELRTLGYPQGVSGIPFRMVAISNGSECGKTQAFSPGANLFTLSGNATTTLLGDLAGQFAIPGVAGMLNLPPLLLGSILGRNTFNFDVAVRAQADGASNEVYKGKIVYTKKVLWLIPINATITNKSYTSSASTLPYDYFGGGRYDANKATIDINSDAIFQQWAFKNHVTSSRQRYFCFVPTASALDIGGGNTTLAKADYLASYVGGAPPTNPKNSPFANFITAFDGDVDNQNEEHISIQGRNGNWLSNELQGVHPVANCSAYCTSGPGYTISGPTSVLCTTPQTYTVNATSAISYTWSASPNGYVTLTPNGNSVTVARNSGSINVLTISVSIETSCGQFLVNKNIKVGSPQEPTFSNLSLVPYPYYGIAANVNTTEVGPYKWYVDGILKKTTSGNWSDAVLGGQCGIQHYFQVEVTNACGSTRNAPYYFTNICTQSARMSDADINQATITPNPANTNIVVTAFDNTAVVNVDMNSTGSYNSRVVGGNQVSTADHTISTTIRQIRIFNVNGKLCKRLNYNNSSNSQETVDVSDLSVGVYFVEITTGTNKIKRQKLLIIR